MAETVRQTQARLTVATLELEHTKQTLADLQAEMKKREELIQDLMIQKRELVLEKDKLQADLAKDSSAAASSSSNNNNNIARDGALHTSV
jgi:formate-dependent nitrite reductase cytochrome c552 subunit